LRFAGVKAFLHRSAGSDPAERRAKIVAAVLTSSAKRGTLVVVRNSQAREVLVKLLADELGTDAAGLEQLAVFVVTKNAECPPSVDLAVLTGFFGSDSFDLPLLARVKSLVVLFDEVEARAALWLANSLSRICDRAGARVPALDRIRETIRRDVTGEGPEFGFDLYANLVRERDTSVNVHGASNSTHVTISFTDGTVHRVASNARFDLFKGRLSIKATRAQELRPGDIVVLLDAAHSALSDQLLTRLDEGVLREHALKRKAFVNLVHAAFKQSSRTLANVARSVNNLSREPVDAATVRTWVVASLDGEPAIPSTLAKTQALVQAIGLQLPPELVEDFFASIALIRRRHRQAGRLLARAIRGMQVKRLDIVTIRKLESEWGFDPHDLLKGSRVAEVEAVVGV
jgi:hypothetical protein